MITAAALVYISILISILVSRARRGDAHVVPVFMFGLSCLIYLVAIPVELQLRGTDVFNRSGEWREASQSELLASVVCAIVMLCSFVLGLGRNLNWGQFAPRGEYVGAVKTVVAFLSLGLVVLFMGNIRSASTYAGNIAQSTQSPMYMFLVHAWMLLMALVLVAYLSRGRSGLVKGLGIFLIMAGWSAYSNDKDAMVVAAVASLAAILRRSASKLSPLGWIGMMVVTGAATLTLARAFSMFRAGKFDMASWVGSDWSVTISDPAGPFGSFVDVARGESGVEIYPGESLLSAPFMWIPRSVWPARPVDVSVQYAQSHMEGWVPGQGLGFSLAADAWLNGSWFGVAAFGFVLGLLGRWLGGAGAHVGGMRPALYAVGYPFVLFVSLRGPLVATTSTLIREALALLVVHGLVVYLRSRRPVRSLRLARTPVMRGNP